MSDSSSPGRAADPADNNPLRQAHARITQLAESVRMIHRHVTGQIDPQVMTLHRQMWELKRATLHAGHPVERMALNGQFSKHRIFADLESAFAFDMFVETGCYRGDTTVFLASRGKPVISIEIDPGFRAATIARLANYPLAEVAAGSSDEVLAARIATIAEVGCVFFYLDAHWRDQIPLRREIALVFAHLPAAVVMVDDFAVPGDDGYAHDVYGDTGLTLDYIAPEIAALGLSAFFPAMPSALDHCWPYVLAPRGTLVLARDPATVARIAALGSLRRLEATPPG